MPVLIPLVVGVVVTEITKFAIIGALAAAAASAAISSREAKRARRNSTAAFNASLRDQTITAKGGINPRLIAYGRTPVGGQVVYAETLGSLKEHLLMVIALAHGEIDAIETVYFNEVPLTIDGSAAVTTAPYFAGGSELVVHAATVPATPFQVTLAFTPQDPAGIAIQDGINGWGSGDSGPPAMLVQGTDYTVSGATITFGAAYEGHPVQISYIRATGVSYAYIWKFTGAAGQDLSTTMIALGAPSWTTNDKCQGMAALIVRLTFAENMWPAGIPNIKSVVRGRKVFDPRSSTTTWSQNAALCARDYLTLQYGVNVASSKIDDVGATNGAANICDEQVQLTSGPDTFQSRYTVNGAINTGDDRLGNLGHFAQALAGSINYSQGKWRIRPGAYTTPTLTLDESKLAGDGVQIVPFASRRDLINGAKGTFLNGDKGYIEDQFPEWSSPTFIAEDGGVALTTSLTMPLIDNHSRAQRLAKIEVYRAREALTLQVTCNLSTYTWQAGDMVSTNLTRYGFSAKPFRVIKRGFTVEGGVKFIFREEPNGLYDWNLGEASVLIGGGNTTLPNPGAVAAPEITSIASGAPFLYKAGDGTFVARIRVTVNPPNDTYVRLGGRLQLQYKRGDWTLADWVLIETDGNATVIWIDPAFDAQNYLIRVRAVNSAGFVSAWTAPQAHACVGRRGGISNLLLNSDWTQDLGVGSGLFPSAETSLRLWNGLNSGLAAVAYGFGRNYAGGTAWNIGPGGAYMFTGTRVAGGFLQIQQIFAIAGSVEFEASVYVSAHRCKVGMHVRWLDVNASFISELVGSPDEVDAGNGIVGSATDPLTSHKRLWLKGIAPSNAFFAVVFLRHHTTNAGSSDSYSFWSKTLACVAPPDVTRQTATPWTAAEADTLRGLGEPLNAVGTGATAGGGQGAAAGHIFWQFDAQTNITVAMKANDLVLINCEYFGVSGETVGFQTPALAGIDVIVAGSGKVAWHIDGLGDASGNVKVNVMHWGPPTASSSIIATAQAQYRAPVDQNVTIYGGGAARFFSAPPSGSGVVSLRVVKVIA